MAWVTGASQSPVDIATGSVAVYQGPSLLLRYEPSDPGAENTGHVVEVPVRCGVNDTAQIRGGSCQLVQ